MNSFGSDTLTKTDCIIVAATGCYSCCGDSIILSNITKNLENNSSFEVNPNPTNGFINIDLGKTQKDVQVKVRNIIGQEIFIKQYHNTKLINLEINSSSGLYFVEVKTAEGEANVMKVIKQ
jgi:hypothetical protein